jgi:hypothetical protein
MRVCVYYRAVDGEECEGKCCGSEGSVIGAKLIRAKEKAPKTTQNKVAVSGDIGSIVRLGPSEFG